MNLRKSTGEKIQIGIISDVLNHFKDIGEGIRSVATADFSDLPENPIWNEVLCMGVMIDGCEVVKILTEQDIQDFHCTKERDYEKTGVWSGNALELWTVLYQYNRMNHWNEGSAIF